MPWKTQFSPSLLLWLFCKTSLLFFFPPLFIWKIIQHLSRGKQSNIYVIKSGFYWIFCGKEKLSRIIHLGSGLNFLFQSYSSKKHPASSPLKCQTQRFYSYLIIYVTKSVAIVFPLFFCFIHVLPSPLPWLIAFNNHVHIKCFSSYCFSTLSPYSFCPFFLY